jgi:hypothetical protein
MKKRLLLWRLHLRNSYIYFILSARASTKDNIPKIISPVNILKSIVAMFSDTEGKIKAAPNHPADKLTNKSETILDHDELTFEAIQKY